MKSKEEAEERSITYKCLHAQLTHFDEFGISNNCRQGRGNVRKPEGTDPHSNAEDLEMLALHTPVLERIPVVFSVDPAIVSVYPA